MHSNVEAIIKNFKIDISIPIRSSPTINNTMIWLFIMRSNYSLSHMRQGSAKWMNPIWNCKNKMIKTQLIQALHSLNKIQLTHLIIVLILKCLLIILLSLGWGMHLRSFPSIFLKSTTIGLSLSITLCIIFIDKKKEWHLNDS